MRPIEGNIYSPFQKKKRNYVLKKSDLPLGFMNIVAEEELIWQRFDATVNRIRASEGFRVTSFKQLMDEVADVTISNKNYEMFYRGQTYDYKNNQSTYYKYGIAKSVILPTICRPERKADGSYKYSVKKTQIIKRYNDLNKMMQAFGEERGSYFNETYYSLFQHYRILPTPFIDITQSLRVAATFALLKSTKGYVYVFGLPYPNQSISYFPDLSIILIKLQNVVPIKAIRPRYQEGFLVGKYPIRPTKSEEDDLANRMVAKFLVDNSNGKFWDDFFPAISEKVLYPENDEIENKLLKVKDELFKI